MTRRRSAALPRRGSMSPALPVSCRLRIVGPEARRCKMLHLDMRADGWNIRSPRACIRCRGESMTICQFYSSMAAAAICVLAVALVSAPAPGSEERGSGNFPLPTAYFHPTMLTFAVGKSSSATTTLTNSSTETLEIHSFSISGPQGNVCAMVIGCGFSLGPGQSCKVTLTCDPIKTGLIGTLTESDNSAAGRHVVALQAK